MKNKSFLVLGVLFSILLTFILISEYKGNYYKLTAEEVHAIAVKNNTLVDSRTLNSIKDSILLIQLSGVVSDSLILPKGMKTMNIKPEELLQAENTKRYKNHNGVIILYSDKFEIATNSWVLLSRLGYKNIKILNEGETDSFKYSFQHN